MAAPQLGANEYSNAPNAGEAGAIFVVLDTIHTRYVDERDMREMILKFLGRAAQAKRAVALAILSDKGLHVYHDYQTSSNVLLAALIKAGLGGMKGDTPPPGVNDAEVTAEAARLTAFSKGDLANCDSVRTSSCAPAWILPLLMFEDVGRAAYGLPGRKALVWVTNVVPFDVDPKTFQFVSPKTLNAGRTRNWRADRWHKGRTLAATRSRGSFPSGGGACALLSTAGVASTRWKRAAALRRALTPSPSV